MYFQRIFINAARGNGLCLNILIAIFSAAREYAMTLATGLIAGARKCEIARRDSAHTRARNIAQRRINEDTIRPAARTR